MNTTNPMRQGRPSCRSRPGHQRLTCSPSGLLLIALLLWLPPLACQQQSGGAGETGDAGEGMQAARADTPPGTPAGADAADTGGGGRTDTAVGRGDTAAGAGAPAEEAGDTTARAPDQAAGGEGAAGPASGDVLNGWRQYEVNCSRCHGQDALGSAFAPDLRESVKGKLSRDAFAQIVKTGRIDRGMPGFASQLNDQQIADIHAYVVARGAGKLGPGRPKS
jgi:mono/diheme cytochrome c family protein